MSTATLDKPAAKLTPKQDAFCDQYPVDFIGAQAAIRAGYSEKGARQQASVLLTNPNVQARLAEIIEERKTRARRTNDEIIQELENIAFSDITKVIEWNESGIAFLKSSDDIPPEVAAAIESVQVVEEQTGDEKTQRMVLKSKVKMHPKLQGLVNLMKHRGMLSDKVQHDYGPQTINVVHYNGSSGNVPPPGQVIEVKPEAPKALPPKARKKGRGIKRISAGKGK